MVIGRYIMELLKIMGTWNYRDVSLTITHLCGMNIMEERDHLTYTIMER